MVADQMKPRIAVYAPSIKLGFRDLDGVDFFRRMAARYDVHWIFRNAPPEALRDDPTIENATICKVGTRRYQLWLYDHALTRHRFDLRVVHEGVGFPKTGYSGLVRRALKFLLQTRLDRAASAVLRGLFRATAPRLPFDPAQFDALLFLGSPKDSFLDDLLRQTRRHGVPSALLASNWDNATSKPFIELPDMMFTWGQQTAALVPGIHGIPAYPVGCPRFETYKKLSAGDQVSAQAQLGMPTGPLYILFAGGGLPFAEDRALSILGDACRAQEADVRVLYRPHPGSWSKHSANTIPTGYQDVIAIDPTFLLGGHDRPDLIPTLFQAVDGLCTPFSTMIVEAARAGLPSLCIAFEDPLHTDFDWVINAKHQPHLQCLYQEDWPSACFDLETLPSAAACLVSKVVAGAHSTEGRALFDMIVKTSEEAFMTRLFAAIDEHLLLKSGATKDDT